MDGNTLMRYNENCNAGLSITKPEGVILSEKIIDG